MPTSAFSKGNHGFERRSITIDSAGKLLGCELVIPRAPVGLVVFAHGSGSSRFSPRNTHVAGVLNQRGLATALIDLLTPRESVVDEQTSQYRFDIPMLADRVISSIDAFHGGHQPGLAQLPIGVFGASTGAAAALIAAARRPNLVRAVVSRGGRPDMAGAELASVQAPTLLIVGGADHQVITLNHTAAASMRCQVEVVIVPGATHLFEEPGALARVERLAADWFVSNMTGAAQSTASPIFHGSK